RSDTGRLHARCTVPLDRLSEPPDDYWAGRADRLTSERDSRLILNSEVEEFVRKVSFENGKQGPPAGDSPGDSSNANHRWTDDYCDRNRPSDYSVRRHGGISGVPEQDRFRQESERVYASAASFAERDPPSTDVYGVS